MSLIASWMWKYARIVARLAVSRGIVLWTGLGGVLVLLVATASHAGRTVHLIEAKSESIRRQYAERRNLLDHVRLDLYRSGIDVRDYLSAHNPQEAAQRRGAIDQTLRRLEDALQQSQHKLPAQEGATFRQLRQDLAGYGEVLRPVLQWDSRTRGQHGDEFLRGQVLPRHQQLLSLADRIGAIDTTEIDTVDASVANVFATFRRELTMNALLAVMIGIVLAVITTRRITVLERVSQERYQEVVRTRGELQELSRRLVAAQEQERRRLSRELHDEVGQSMSAMVVELGGLEATLPGCDAAASDRLASVRQLAERSIGAIRNMALLLRPSMLDDLGLVPALRWQAREVARRSGMHLKVAAERVSDDLPDEYRVCIYRIVQEALHNATRHAKATSVRVAISQDPQRIFVTVHDDGIGFEVGKDKGLGLLGMEERARSLGGFLGIDSTPGRGTIVSIALPVPAYT